MKRRLFGLLSQQLKQIILSSLLLFSASLITPSHAQQLETQTIKAEHIIKKLNRTGKLVFKRTLNLSFKSSGYLEVLNIDEGESFTKGQLLAELDSAELVAEKMPAMHVYFRLKEMLNELVPYSVKI